MPFYLGHDLADSRLLEWVAPQALEGVSVLTAYPLATDVDHPGIRFHQVLLAEYAPQLEMNRWTIYGQAVAEVMTAVLREGGRDLNRKSVIEAAERLKNWQGTLTPPISFSPKNHQAVTSLRVAQVRLGKFHTVFRLDQNSMTCVYQYPWNPDEASALREALHQGKTFAFPTETFYGVGGNAFSEELVEQIFKIKERPRHKPLLVLANRTLLPNSLSTPIRNRSTFSRTILARSPHFGFASKRQLTSFPCTDLNGRWPFDIPVLQPFGICSISEIAQ